MTWKYTEEFRAQVVAALAAAPESVGAIARAWGVSEYSVRLWAQQAGLKLPASERRQRWGAKRGGVASARVRWGDGTEERGKRAAALRRKGASFRQIAEACGYASASAARYAVLRSSTKRRAPKAEAQT